mgnify:CR=1 FL=1
MQTAELNIAGYDMLASAIIERAVEDWRYLCHIAEDPRDDLKTYRLLHGRERDSFCSLELFFQSRWCGTLCGEIDPQKIINRVEYERRHATFKPTNRGRRGTVYHCFGKSLTMSEWGKVIGVPASTIHGRIKRGWPLEKALSAQKHVNQNK